MSDDIHRPEPVSGDAGWPMPSADTRRLLQPIPVWVPSPREDGDARGSDQSAT